MTQVSKDDLRVYLRETEKEITILRFTAKWCGPCQKLSPILKEILSKYDECDYNLITFDIDKEPGIYSFFKRYKMVNGIPALLFYKKSDYDENSFYVPCESISGLNFNLIINTLDMLLKK
tara:strand:- start:1877 stop:2236 length:360 start_codon:yes stop_codon:yes gene_type:complete